MNYDPVSNTSADLTVDVLSQDQEARAMSRCAEAATDPTELREFLMALGLIPTPRVRVPRSLRPSEIARKEQA